MSLKIDRELQVAAKTGKIVIGSKSAIKRAKIGGAIPEDIKEDIIYYAKLSNIPVIEFHGSSWDLGAILGKPFMVSAVSIIDEGESELLKFAESDVKSRA
ncbi:MAG: 50S ribosomal protein L30e [Candidatus Methanomethylicia archaeon]